MGGARFHKHSHATSQYVLPESVRASVPLDEHFFPWGKDSAESRSYTGGRLCVASYLYTP